MNLPSERAAQAQRGQGQFVVPFLLLAAAAIALTIVLLRHVDDGPRW